MNPSFSKLRLRYRMIQAGVPEKALPQEMTDTDVINFLLDHIDDLSERLAGREAEDRLEGEVAWE